MRHTYTLSSTRPHRNRGGTLNMPTNIGSLNESALHKSLKDLKALDGDILECPVDGYIVDIKQTDRLVEIQTRNLHRVVSKIYDLVERYSLHLVYPIAARTTITKTLENGIEIQRRSPKKGTIYEVFAALVSAPTLITHPHFSLEVAMIHEEQVRVFDEKKGWRRRHWVIVERRLIELITTHCFKGATDLWMLFAGRLPAQFTTRDIAESVHITRRLAQQAVYCLRHCGAIDIVGKKRNELIYKLTNSD